MSSTTIWDILPQQLSRPSFTNYPIEEDPFWGCYEKNAINSSIHIAILSRTYLNLILDKRKTVESRFSVQRRLPYKKVEVGDIILFKESGGSIQGIGYVSKVNFLELTDDSSLTTIKKQYAEKLQIQDDSFWERHSNSAYCSLIELEHVRRINPMQFSKRDRNAWVTFKSS